MRAHKQMGDCSQQWACFVFHFSASKTDYTTSSYLITKAVALHHYSKLLSRTNFPFFLI